MLQRMTTSELAGIEENCAVSTHVAKKLQTGQKTSVST